VDRARALRIAALDPAAPYRSALTDPEVGLPNAQLVLDHFHVSPAHERSVVHSDDSPNQC
jgi:hypothetical protein